jgi:hypothetical protein
MATELTSQRTEHLVFYLVIGISLMLTVGWKWIMDIADMINNSAQAVGPPPSQATS